MSGSAEANPHQHSVGFNLGAIALVLALTAVGIAYAIDAAARTANNADRQDDQAMLSRVLGGHELAIPRSWFRYEEQRAEGFAKQIDLRFELPLGAAGQLEPIEVTLLPRSRARPSATLLDGVYLHQFGEAQLAGVPGLVGKPLRLGDGYENEVVWYDALSADPFVAKCSKPVVDSPQAQCLRTVYLGPGIAAIYAFPEAALAGWKTFDALLLERMRRIGAL